LLGERSKDIIRDIIKRESIKRRGKLFKKGEGGTFFIKDFHRRIKKKK
jgi:hypothetical protein